MSTVIASAIYITAIIAIVALAAKAPPPEPPYGWIFSETKALEEKGETRTKEGDK